MKIILNQEEVCRIVAEHLAKEKGKPQAYAISHITKKKPYSYEKEWFLECEEVEQPKN